MPKNTRVHRCVDALKKAKEESGSAIAICQASTNQSYATGKKLKEAIAAKVTRPVADKATKKLGDENDDKWEAEETKKGYWTPAADDITGYNSKTSDNADDDFKHGRWTDETRSKKYGKKIMNKNKQTNEGYSAYVRRLLEGVPSRETKAEAMNNAYSVYSRLGHLFLEAEFAHPAARRLGGTGRGTAGIRNPRARAGANRAVKRMDKKLGVKTNPLAPDAIQADMNTRSIAAAEALKAGKEPKEIGHGPGHGMAGTTPRK